MLPLNGPGQALDVHFQSYSELGGGQSSKQVTSGGSAVMTFTPEDTELLTVEPGGD